jgi:single-strand DNA-binding protein
MEQLNKVELRGIVGNIRIQQVNNTRVARMLVATDYIYENRQGEKVCETTWHSVNVWEEKSSVPLDKIQRGDGVLYIQGRLRNTRYTDAHGVERMLTEIVGNKLEKLN